MIHGREPRVPDVALERYRLGELPRAEMDRLDALLGTDAVLRDRLQQLAASDDEIAGTHLAPHLAAAVREHRRADEAARRHRHSLRRLVLASALGAGVMAVAIAQPWSRVESPRDADTIKGLAPSLTVYRQTATGSETLANGAPARRGDVLRLGYVSAGRRYGVILSIDGRGVVTWHLPPSGDLPAELRASGTVLLDQAYELDDAPAFERFFFVTADRPFDVATVREAARRVAAQGAAAPSALPLPSSFSQTAFSIQKEVKP